MIEHIPRHRADNVPNEPESGPVVNEFLRGLTYEQLFARYVSVYSQFDQESRGGDDINRLQMAEIEIAYPGLYALIEKMATTESDEALSNGIVLGAVTLLSIIKSTVEVEEFNQLLRES